MKRILPAVCLILAVLIAIVSIVTVSFSWFEPGTKEGIGLAFNDETKLRAQNCTITTFEGTKNQDGTYYYGVTNVGTDNVTINATTSGDTTTPAIKYYRTVITNSSEDYDTVVSLYLSSFSPSDGNASIGVAYPTNSYRTFTVTQKDIHIVRNAYVPRKIVTDQNPGELVIEWFVKCDSGSVTFNPSEVYLMYS